MQAFRRKIYVYGRILGHVAVVPGSKCCDRPVDWKFLLTTTFNCDKLFVGLLVLFLQRLVTFGTRRGASLLSLFTREASE